MRYLDIKTTLNEGYTIGDIAETLWGAAVTAAFENYPNPAQPQDVNRIMASLKNLSYTKTRADGLESSITDSITFVNQISMKEHLADIKNWHLIYYLNGRIIPCISRKHIVIGVIHSLFCVLRYYIMLINCC